MEKTSWIVQPRWNMLGRWFATRFLVRPAQGVAGENADGRRADVPGAEMRVVCCAD